MRKILFRGKRIDNGEWVEGYLIQKGGETLIVRYPYCTDKVHETSWSEFCFGGFIEVIPETVGQYTGLTDKNGRKIFEGDILKEYGSDPEHSLMVIKNTGFGCFLEFYLGGEKCGTEQVGHTGWLSYDEVIGNIHDNPKLLNNFKNQ